MLRNLKLEKGYKILIKYENRNQEQEHKKSMLLTLKIRLQKTKIITEVHLRDRKIGNFRNVCFSVW